MLREKQFDTGVLMINYAEGPLSGPPSGPFARRRRSLAVFSADDAESDDKDGMSLRWTCEGTANQIVCLGSIGLNTMLQT